MKHAGHHAPQEARQQVALLVPPGHQHRRAGQHDQRLDHGAGPKPFPEKPGFKEGNEHRIGGKGNGGNGYGSRLGGMEEGDPMGRPQGAQQGHSPIIPATMEAQREPPQQEIEQ